MPTTECVYYTNKLVSGSENVCVWDSWIHTMKNSAIGSLPSVLSTEECTDTEKHRKIVIIYINKGNCNCIS